MNSPTCVWVLADGSPCGAPTTYTMPKDQDDNRFRQHAPYCPTHQEKADDE